MSKTRDWAFLINLLGIVVFFTMIIISIYVSIYALPFLGMGPPLSKGCEPYRISVFFWRENYVLASQIHPRFTQHHAETGTGTSPITDLRKDGPLGWRGDHVTLY